MSNVLPPVPPMIATCPDHNVPMVMKNGKNGTTFQGCPFYKDYHCTQTADLNGVPTKKSHPFPTTTTTTTQTAVPAVMPPDWRTRSTTVPHLPPLDVLSQQATNQRNIYEQLLKLNQAVTELQFCYSEMKSRLDSLTSAENSNAK